MSRFYRYRLPPWCRYWLIVIERASLPIMVFQLIRTLIWPTTFDIFLSGLCIGLFFLFYLKWI
ncbi:hypothetical protein NC797_05185 [Aquibacillus sp. 3ASR75-11]|uniref:Uncharacterized protein n=1 Tax=Terrihalobacillus insolitus TaxID=2950438 RepID=A0A9X3WU05_9BACI|nr:hypothetical protein [Terrihalobacillus insolitus]MDC3412482.1 hypothetical protein [Terrihalobacillus insolitus]MDC3423901.1 hypothetical protein [Terrihalobacillus insolitus]